MASKARGWSEELLERAARVRRESKYVEFKEQFDPSNAHDWCEIIKDLAAIANSGGGSVLFGVKNDGSVSSWDPARIAALDPAQIVDKVARYTGVQSDFEIADVVREDGRVPLILVHPVPVPLVFMQAGTYDVGDGKQKTAFGKGTVYFRLLSEKCSGLRGA